MSQAEQEKIGLIGDHAYSFLKFLNIGGETVVKMRNPWGKTVWKGEWSFESKKWTPELRQKYHYTYQPNDGAFFIPWKEFTKYFSNFVISRIDPTFLHTSHRLNSAAHHSNYVRMLVKEEGVYNLSVYQESKRKHQGKDYEYSDVRMVVLKEHGQEINYVCSVNKSKSHAVFVETRLTPGFYYVAVKVDWGAKQPRSIVLTSYGCERVEFEDLDASIAPLFKKEMVRSFSNKAKGKVKKYEKLKLPEATNESYFSIEEGIGYIKVKNPTNRWFRSTMTLSTSGMKIIKPDKLPHVFDMNPQSEKVIGFWISSRGYSYESSESMETKGW